MGWSTVRAELYKNWIVVRRNYFRLFDVTLWPIILFFSITLFLRFVSPTAKIMTMAITGLIGWRAVYHFQVESNVAYMDDYWATNISQILVSPLKMRDIIVSGVIAGLAKFLLVLGIFLAFAYTLFSFHIPSLPIFMLGIAYLGFTGLILGIITFSFVILYREKAVTFSFILPDLFVLLSGVYYPISIFPQPIVAFVHLLPTFYGFELLKSMVGMGQANYLGMIVCSALWFAFSLLFLSWAIKRAKKTGKLCKFG